MATTTEAAGGDAPGRQASLAWRIAKGILLAALAVFVGMPGLGWVAILVIGARRLYDVGGCPSLPMPPADDGGLFAAIICDALY